ncbi:hypothetical protein [uncultured Bdellovibrio sp.]|uniref:hypothetical protein n=1 Tax=Bdellovibrio sp. HCB-162 TaxID=3394234 RepID=UPI00260077FD|nr:hypothetical protein [uncultured Bdellovibrio sp.]
MRPLGNKGFMIVQALMGAMLLGILGLAFAGLVKDMWMENQTLQSKNDELTLAQVIRQQISTPSLCNASFEVGRRSFNPTATSRNISVRLNPTNPASVVAQGVTLQNWNLTVQSFSLNNITKAVASFAGETLYAGDLSLQAQATNGRKNIYKSKTLGKIFLRVDDATQTITSCFISEDGTGIASSACASLGGTFNETTSVCDISNLKQRLLASVGQCPNGETMTGFDAQGKMLCAVPAAPAVASNYQCRGSVTVGCSDSGGGGNVASIRGANCCPAQTVSCEPVGKTHTGGSCGPHGDRMNVYQDYICTCKGVL